MLMWGGGLEKEPNLSKILLQNNPLPFLPSIHPGYSFLLAVVEFREIFPVF